MRVKNVARLAGMVAGIALLAGGHAAMAREIKGAIGLPPTHVLTTPYHYMEKTLPEKTGGALTMKGYYGSLLSYSETATGVRDNITDVGFVVTAYHPAEFREINLPAELAMLGKNSLAMTGAISEYTFTCAECLREFEVFNHVYLGTIAPPPYIIMSKKPVATIADLKGLKMRTGASAYSRWAEHFGAQPARISATDTYEALGQGTIEANLHPVTELVGLSFADVVGYWTDMPIGTYNGVSTYSTNLDTWRSLSASERKAMIDTAAEGTAITTIDYLLFAEEAQAKAARDKGVTRVEPSEELRKASAEFVANDVAKAVGLLESNYKIANAGEKVARFRALVDKWTGLVADVGMDKDKYTALLKSEVFGKLDAAKYGM